MNNYSGKKQFGGDFKGSFRGGFQNRNKFGGKNNFEGPKAMYTATCAKCGKTCEVPFRPNGAKPVYCNDCFVRDDSAPRRDFAPRPQFQHQAPAPRNDQAFNDLKSELRLVNSNLERLISLMTAAKQAPLADAEPKARKATKKKTK